MPYIKEKKVCPSHVAIHGGEIDNNDFEATTLLFIPITFLVFMFFNSTTYFFTFTEVKF